MQPFTDIMAQIAALLSITEAAAGVLVSLITILIVMLPVMWATSTRNNPIALWLVIFFILEVFLTAVGLMPIWVISATLAVIALAVALGGTKAIGV